MMLVGAMAAALFPAREIVAAFGAAGTPEIDASSGISALTLLSGVLLVIKSRR